MAISDAEVFREPTEILPMGGGYDWRCFTGHGPYFLCKDGLPLRDSSEWNRHGWRVSAVEIGQEEAIKRFAAYVAELEARLHQAKLILRPLAEAAEGYEDRAPDERSWAGLTLLDARRARSFLASMEKADG